MPGHDAPIECQYLGFDRQQLGPQSSNARARDLGKPRVLDIGNDFQEPLNAVASNWRHDPELGEVRADRVDNRRLLPDEQMPCAMKHHAALLFGRLGRHEPKVVLTKAPEQDRKSTRLNSSHVAISY